MAHSHANRAGRLLILGLALTSLGACLDDGLPWGTLEASMEASFGPHLMNWYPIFCLVDTASSFQ